MMNDFRSVETICNIKVRNNYLGKYTRNTNHTTKVIQSSQEVLRRAGKQLTKQVTVEMK